MTSFWDSKFSGEDFYYGKSPNVFFADFLSNLKSKGKLLLPAEGEGRNAVHAAKLGWEVTAFDSSEVARKKALNFAKSEGVNIEYDLLDIADYRADREEFDLIALMSIHLPEGLRKSFHNEIIQALKPGGLIFEVAFAQEQIQNHSGGPANIDLLYSLEILKEDYKGLLQKKLCQQQVMLNEGRHQGVAEVLVFVGEKPVGEK